MKTIKNCKHCYQLFEPRRSNHVYCTASCKTKASYKRNAYKYVPGHYQKQTEVENNSEQNKAIAVTTKKDLKDRNDINLSSISNAAIGAVTADTISYGLKKFLAPNALPATKGDLKLLTEKLLGRYHLVKNLPSNMKGESPYFDMVTQVIIYNK